jgi:hypothetical protein
MMARAKSGKIFLREPKETHRRQQTAPMFGVRRVFEILSEMNERAGRLDQTLEEIVVPGVPVQPELLENVVCLIIIPAIPAPEICAIIGMSCYWAAPGVGGPPFQLADEPRNPLAFAHEGLNLIMARIMSKLARFAFPGKTGALQSRYSGVPKNLLGCSQR